MGRRVERESVPRRLFVWGEMAAKCSICSHGERTAIDRALVAGEPYRHIAARTGTSVTSLRRHKESHLAEVVERAVKLREVAIERQVVTQEEQKDTAALDVDAELRNVFTRLNKMLNACDAWLTDAEDAAVYDLNPRAHEVKVTYEVEDGETPQGRPIRKRRKATLAELIERIETGIPTASVLLVETKSADPRKLIVETANALRPSVELLAKLVGRLDESPKINLYVSRPDLSLLSDEELASLEVLSRKVDRGEVTR